MKILSNKQYKQLLTNIDTYRRMYLDQCRLTAKRELGISNARMIIDELLCENHELKSKIKLLGK